MLHKPRGGVIKYGILALVVSAVLVLASIVIVPYLTTTISSGSENHRRLIVVDQRSVPRQSLGEYGQPVTTYEQFYDFHYVKVGDLNPNSSVWVLYPFDSVVDTLYQKPLTSFDQQTRKDIYAKIDRFAFYQLIRLPPWLGGNENDTSAYRAYNAITLTVKCQVHYWGDLGRFRLEDPCAGDMYRPWDGLAIEGPAAAGFSGGLIISKDNIQGLSTLDLSVDADGYFVASKPDMSPNKNGVAGEGRTFSTTELENSDLALIKSANEYAGYNLPFIPQLSQDISLTDVQPSYSLNEFDCCTTAYLAFQASYSSYGAVTIISAESDSVPSLDLTSSTVSLKNGTIALNMNNTLVSSLLELPTPGEIGCHYFSNPDSGSKMSYSLKYSSHVAGTFAAFYAPDPNTGTGGQMAASSTPTNYCSGSDALVWGKSMDGKDIVIHIHAVQYTLDQLVTLVQSLPVRK